MQHHDILDIVPEHYTGTDIEVKATAEFEETSGAIDFFTIAKQRLLNVNQWHAVAGIISASFKAVDKDGNKLDRSVVKGDHMRVDIPGPGSAEGDGYDWVMIEDVKEINNDDVQSTGFRVRPVSNPSGDTKNVAHFYDPSSTSNFIVTREGKKVTASIIDRNIKPNTATKSLTDKVRGTAVGLSAIAFFSKLQWQNLADGIVKND